MIATSFMQSKEWLEVISLRQHITDSAISFKLKPPSETDARVQSPHCILLSSHVSLWTGASAEKPKMAQ